MHPDPSTYSSQINMNPQFPEHEHLNCPRCESSNTKFCYYNNYNLSQPRHFCKNCRRYWTKGGTLRNIPVGGGARKITKRSSNPAKRPANSSSPTSPATPPPPPPAQPKPEPSGIFGFSVNQTEVGGGSFSSFRSPAGSNHGARFGSFLIDGLSTNLAGGSPATDAFRINHSSANNDNNQSKNDGESSCWNGGNGWPNLSIDPPGSDFH